MAALITYDEVPETGKELFVAAAVERHRGGELYRTALSADRYQRQRNETVEEFVKIIFSEDGHAFEDPTASRLRIKSNFFKRLNVQRAMYSLGNGVTFSEEGVKEKLGPRFDDDLIEIGVDSLTHGVCFAFWNLDRVEVFPVTEFAPIWDASTGALRAGVRFWRVAHDKPLNAVLYEEDGYTGYAEVDGVMTETEEKSPYKVVYEETAVDGLVRVSGENYTRFPIVPVWGSDARQSTLVGMRGAIDAYDLIKSGLANDVQDCAQIYWIVENAGGMQDADLARFRDRLKFTHIANVDSEDGGAATPYAQEVPYQSRAAVLKQIRDDLFEDFGALDVHAVAAGATNDHIDAAYQPVDAEAAEFERHMRTAVMDLLELQGIVAEPIFARGKVSNVREQVEVVALESQWLDRRTILRKLPNIAPSEVDAILRKLDGEEASVFGGE